MTVIFAFNPREILIGGVHYALDKCLEKAVNSKLLEINIYLLLTLTVSACADSDPVR